MGEAQHQTTPETQRDEIPPALSPEEWGGEVPVIRDGWVLNRLGISRGLPAYRLAVAALALHGLEVEGQPAGFTWQDVDDERKYAREVGRLADMDEEKGKTSGCDAWLRDAEELRRLAARATRRAALIASLLPPRETTEKSNG